jgi:membrane-associated PAP2 superfamily phosphatase
MNGRPARDVRRSTWPALVLLASVIVLFECTQLDLAVQDWLYDFSRERWLVDAAAPWPRLAFYTGPKVLLIAFGVGLLALAAGPARWRDRLHAGRCERRACLLVFLTLATAPSLIGALKATTNVFCPSEIQRYGGDIAYVPVTTCYSPENRPAKRGRCFPAGHASGGFALLALSAFARTRKGQVIGWSIGAVAGLWMGLYQMAKGAHFLSHTLVTALVAWLVYVGWERVLDARWFAAPAVAASRTPPASAHNGRP